MWILELAGQALRPSKLQLCGKLLSLQVLYAVGRVVLRWLCN